MIISINLIAQGIEFFMKKTLIIFLLFLSSILLILYIGNYLNIRNSDKTSINLFSDEALDWWSKGEKSKDTDYKIKCYTKALELGTLSSTNKAAIYGSRGIQKINKSDLDGAIADFNKSIKLNPKGLNIYSASPSLLLIFDFARNALF